MGQLAEAIEPDVCDKARAPNLPDWNETFHSKPPNLKLGQPRTCLAG